jgi:23S rRNA pseudouridine1911/1915/1917 synthase
VSDHQNNFKFSGPGTLRLDKFLVSNLPDYSRSRLQGLIQDGFVKVNGVQAKKGGQDLQGGDLVEIRIPPPVPTDLVPEDIPLQVVYEDEHVLVINKPAGMVVHPAAGHFTGTLVHAALAHAPEMEGIGGEQRPGVVHRLDKDTSGLILMAKDDRTHRWLQDQFKLRKVRKTYLALVDGHPPTPQGRIEAAIGRDQSHRKQMMVVPDQKGRQAVSEYFTRERFPQHSLLEVHPLTGRTHQIRLHLAFIGCPIVGDLVYGHKKSSLPIGRHFLHAAQLLITLPGEISPRQFDAPLPPDLQAVLQELQQERK